VTFTSWDGTQLFYRAWLHDGKASKCVLLFHRGHEHSGRFEELAHVLRDAGYAVFANDARGHGQSPGDRGWAESFACLARDADCFARHVTL